MKGLMVTFEGCDGSGKTTQAALFADYLRAEGRNVLQFREPGGTDLGESLRELIKFGDGTAEAELFMLAAARAQLVNKVLRPSIQQGMVVIGDRFADSTYAYQVCGRGVDPLLVENLKEGACREVRPSLTFLIDVPLDISIGRMKARGGGQEDVFERAEEGFMRRVRDGYLDLAKREGSRIAVIDGSGTPDQVFSSVTRVWRAFCGGGVAESGLRKGKTVDRKRETSETIA